MELVGVDIRTIILSIAAVSNFILGTLTYLRSRLKSSIFFVLTVIGVGIWSVGINFYIQPGVGALTYFWSDVNYMTAAIFSVSFFFFAYYFASEDKDMNIIMGVTIALSLIIMLLLILSPGINQSVITEINEIGPYAKSQAFGWAYPFYSLFIFIYFTSGLVILIRKFSKAEGTEKKQLKFIILGTGISIILGITTNLILPALGYQGNDWVGPVGSLVFVFFITYAITRHQLWNFRIIAIELFVALMILTLFLQIFAAEGFLDSTIKTIIFAVASVFSFYLIRGLLKEVDLREQMEHLALKLQTANRRLQEIDIEKSDFVSITSHQLRTPLTVIKGYASMLLEGAFGKIKDKRILQAIDKIFQGSQRLVLVIQEFTNISRIEKGEMEYIFIRINLRGVISEAIEYFKPILKEQKQEVTFYPGMGTGYIVEGDPEKLKQVFYNVLDNAIKYTPSGGKIYIDIEDDKKNKTIKASVKDTGMGIQKEMMSRLFQKFSRTGGSFKLHTEGRGLGLYIAKQIMDAHGGKIWAESGGRNKGTTFYVEFPNPEYVQKRKEIKDFLEDI